MTQTIETPPSGYEQAPHGKAALAKTHPEATREGMRARAAQVVDSSAAWHTEPTGAAPTAAAPHFAMKPAPSVTPVSTAEALDDARLVALEGRVGTLEARPPPVQHVTWADLVDRWTSRKWLAAVVPGVVAFLTLLGTLFGDVDPRIPLVIGGLATFLGSVFIVKEGDTDRAVAVEQLKSDAERAKAAANVAIMAPRAGREFSGPVPPVR